jgi:ferredoxin-NADP reductase
MTDAKPRTVRAPEILWRAAEILEILSETPRVKSLWLRVPSWPGHRPGQHVDVRLTAEDGYQAERSYSLASAPETALPGREVIELTIERLGEGEVSPYLTEEVRAGDRIELRGPIGGYFTWTVADGGPLVLVAGGTGIVPLMSMLRHRAQRRSNVPAWLLYSSRDFDDIIYREELDRLAAADDRLSVVHTLTRGAPAEWSSFERRIDPEMLASVAPRPEMRPLCYVCGPTEMVESVSNALVDLGHDPERVKTERFGPSGD